MSIPDSIERNFEIIKKNKNQQRQQIIKTLKNTDSKIIEINIGYNWLDEDLYFELCEKNYILLYQENDDCDGTKIIVLYSGNDNNKIPEIIDEKTVSFYNYYSGCFGKLIKGKYYIDKIVDRGNIKIVSASSFDIYPSHYLLYIE
jgi:hypothetical protein